MIESGAAVRGRPIFRQKTIRLASALAHETEHDAARQALGGFLDKIIIPPGDGPLRVVGNLEEVLTAASGWNGSTLLLSIMVVAAARNRRYRQRCTWLPHDPAYSIQDAA